jgi:hypothetical protein
MKAIHRVTANSKRGRQAIRIGQDTNPGALTPEQREWNARVEARKAEKRALKASTTLKAKP